MRFPKGIRVKDIRQGAGDVASNGRIALIHYDCFLPRGEKADTSRDKLYQVQFEIGQRNVFPGIEYGVVGMAVGGIRSVRVVRHQSSIAKICAPASGVVRTGRFTGAGAARRESLMPAAADPLQPTSRTRTALHAGCGARPR
jgi:hypothetical protein